MHIDFSEHQGLHIHDNVAPTVRRTKVLRMSLLSSDLVTHSLSGVKHLEIYLGLLKKLSVQNEF